MLKITGGKYRGRLLKIPPNIRPTSNKVREALYNIVGERVFQAIFLELFAGSGIVGIEALSRGAKKVVFIEKNRNVARTIEENLKIINNLEKAEIIVGDVLNGLKKLSKNKEKFDIIFLDPPYKEKLLTISTLEFISSIDIFKKNCIIIVEHYKKISLPEQVGILKKVKIYKYGDTQLLFYNLNKEKNNENSHMSWKF